MSEKDYIVKSESMVVGLRTNTNQVVLIKPESVDTDIDEIDEIDKIDKNLNEYEMDKYIMEKYPIMDEDRERTIKRIKLESNFYLMFRNLFKILINQTENETNKSAIITILDSFFTPDNKIFGYRDKMKIIIKKIKNILKEKIEWTEISEDVEIEDLLDCLDLNREDCEAN